MNETETSDDPRTPDPIAPRPAAASRAAGPREKGPESQEREAAWRRGESRETERAGSPDGKRDPYSALSSPSVAHHAFAALAENVRDYAIFLMDADGIITFWGEGARLIKWWTRDQAEGGHLRMLYLDGGSEDGTAQAHLEQATRQGEVVSEGQRVRSDGSTFWAGVTLTALRDLEGTLLGFAKVTRDLTAAHAADEALRSAKEATESGKKMEAENRAKGEFLATMAHELRTPLQAIIGYADVLDLQIAKVLTPEQRAQLQRIRSSGQHVIALTQEVLDFSRLEVGRLSLHCAEAKLGDAIEGALEMIEPQAAARELEVSNAVATSSARLTYWGNQERVRQILLNFLGNALKFTAPGGRITVSAGSTHQAPPDAEVVGDGPWAYIRVEDTGEGIPADRLQYIFEPYTQVEGSERPSGGAGLGLAISRRLARLMDGDITASSRVGIGSSFFLWLPVKPRRGSTLA